MGRTTMPANNLVEKFDKEYGNDDAQFEFVAFIDGDESTDTATLREEVKEFRSTWKRPQSSFLQETDPFSIKSIGALGRVLLSLTVICALAAITTNLTRGVRSVRRKPHAPSEESSHEV